MDLSFLSPQEQEAVKQGDYSKLSDENLAKLQGQVQHPKPKPPTASQQDAQKNVETVGKDLAYATDVLSQIESGSGLMATPYGYVQSFGEKLGINPEVGQYQALVKGLASPVARALFAEKGNLAEGDVERAMVLFPTIYDSTEQRKAKIESILNLLNNATGKDWSQSFLGKKIQKDQPSKPQADEEVY